MAESDAEAPGLTAAQQAIRRQIEDLGPWFHNMWIGGVRTAPDHFLFDYPNVKYQRFRDTLPADLSGKSVLDIGCNAGFYSMEMKRRGAARVLGIDTDEQYLAQARFAAEVEQLEIDYRRLSVWDVGALGERFDLVLFMGVFYHLRHPLLALDLIREHVARDLFLFQSMQRGSADTLRMEKDYEIKETAIFDQPGYPKMHFVEESYSGDSTNWWIPNRACTEAMLRSAGFSIVAHPEEEVYLCQAAQLALEPGARCVYPAECPREDGQRS
ncbi:MAG TPA: TIGR04290 family methyltransferase [Acidobacteriaceae bacterium]